MILKVEAFRQGVPRLERERDAALHIPSVGFI